MRWMAAVVPSLLVLAGAARAEEAAFDVDVAPGPAAQVLAALSRQTGLQPLFAEDVVQGVQSPGVHGHLALREAVARALAGTGLAYEFTGPATVAITRAPPPPPPARPAAAPEPQNAELEEVAVTGERERSYTAAAATTGTKTDTPLMETPLSVQVIPQQVLQDQDARTLNEALKNVSGVRAHDSSGISENIDIRGFNTGHQTTFRNGFRIDQDLAGGLRPLYNVESIEVLKGPAAVLYGRVEPGGIVNLLTKQPQATPRYAMGGEVGSWEHYLTTIDATGPLDADKTFLYRLNAAYENNHSFRDEIHSETLFIAPTATWNIGPRTRVTVEAEYDRNSVIDDEGLALPYDEAAQQFVWLPRSRNLTPSKPVKFTNTLLGLNWSHQFNGDWSIRHQIVSHRSKMATDGIMVVSGFNQVGSTWTADRSFVAFRDSGTTTTATILDVTGHFETAGLRHTLLLGGDFYYVKTPFTFQNSNTGSTIDVFTMEISGPPLALDPAFIISADGTNKSYGAYLQDQVRLPGNFHVLGGLRYQKVTHTGWASLGSGYGGTGLPVPDPRQDDSAFTPRAGLLWQARDWLSLYGSYATNFGANNGRDWQERPLKPESAKQYELGAKTELFGGRLRAVLALYDLTKTNVAAADLSHPGFSVAIGEINSRGVEFDLQGEVARGWNVTTSLTHDNVVVTKTTPGSGYVEGNRLANVPKNMVNLSTNYKFLFGLKLGGGVNWTDSTVDETVPYTTPGYTVFDAMVSYELDAGKQKYTAQLNIKNLLNKSYYHSATHYGNYGYLAWGAPRSVSASLNVEF